MHISPGQIKIDLDVFEIEDGELTVNVPGIQSLLEGSSGGVAVVEKTWDLAYLEVGEGLAAVALENGCLYYWVEDADGIEEDGYTAVLSDDSGFWALAAKYLIFKNSFIDPGDSFQPVTNHLSGGSYKVDLISEGNITLQVADSGGNIQKTVDVTGNTMIYVDYGDNLEFRLTNNPFNLPEDYTPQGITLSLDGNFLYVSDMANNKVYKYDVSDWGNVTEIGPSFKPSPTPLGIAVSPDGNTLYYSYIGSDGRVYVCDISD